MPKARKTIAQSGILPYRGRDDTLEFLLVTSVRSRRWVIPKGHIESGLTPRQSAEKEAFEEAGVNGRITPERIGYYLYNKDDVAGGSPYQVEVFAMQVLDVMESWPEDVSRKRKWMSPADAAAAVAEEDLGKLILSFAANLNT